MKAKGLYGHGLTIVILPLKFQNCCPLIIKALM